MLGMKDNPITLIMQWRTRIVLVKTSLVEEAVMNALPDLQIGLVYWPSYRSNQKSCWRGTEI